MTRQQSCSIQQSTVCPITTSHCLSQMESVLLAVNKACYKPPSVGIGNVNFSPCSPQSGENMSSMYNNPAQTEIGQNNERWLTGCMEVCRALAVGSCFTYSGADFYLQVYYCLFWLMLMYWDIDIFLLKSDLRWTCALEKPFCCLRLPESFYFANFVASEALQCLLCAADCCVSWQ